MSQSDLAPGEWYELDGSGEETISLTGDSSIILKFRCRWAERYTFANTYFTVGTPYPERDHMVVLNVKFAGVVPSYANVPSFFAPRNEMYQEADIIVTYGPKLTEFPDEDDEAYYQEWDIGGESVDIGVGRKWRDAGTDVEITQSITKPLTNYRFRTVTTEVSDLNNFESLVGKINLTAWRGKDAELMLYLGARVRLKPGIDGNPIFICDHNVVRREVSWNKVWRNPLPKRRSDGSLIYNNNQLVMADGVAGTAGYDSLIPDLYELAEFADVLGP